MRAAPWSSWTCAPATCWRWFRRRRSIPNYFVGGLTAEEFQKETARLNDPKLRPATSTARRRKITRPARFSNPSSGLPRWKTVSTRINFTMCNPTRRGRAKAAFTSARGKSKTLVPPGDYNFTARHRGFEQHLFHHRRPAHGHRKNRPAGREISFWRTHRPADAAGNEGNFPDARTGKKIRLARRRFGEHLFRPGRNGRDADANGRSLFGHRQRRHGASGRGWLSASSRKTRLPAKPPRISRPASCATKSASAPRSLKILRDAMLAETEDPEGTGHPAFTRRFGSEIAHLRQDRHGAGEERAQSVN